MSQSRLADGQFGEKHNKKKQTNKRLSLNSAPSLNHPRRIHKVQEFGVFLNHSFYFSLSGDGETATCVTSRPVLVRWINPEARHHLQ